MYQIVEMHFQMFDKLKVFMKRMNILLIFDHQPKMRLVNRSKIGIEMLTQRIRAKGAQVVVIKLFI